MHSHSRHFLKSKFNYIFSALKQEEIKTCFSLCAIEGNFDSFRWCHEDLNALERNKGRLIISQVVSLPQEMKSTGPRCLNEDATVQSKNNARKYTLSISFFLSFLLHSVCLATGLLGPYQNWPPNQSLGPSLWRGKVKRENDLFLHTVQ